MDSSGLIVFNGDFGLALAIVAPRLDVLWHIQIRILNSRARTTTVSDVI